MSAPERALRAIPGFADAVIRARLSDGPTNASFLVERGGERFVLRIDTPEARRLGLDRDAEHAIAKALAAAGLAEAPVACNRAFGVVLRRYLPGRPWTRRDIRQTANLERLASVLRRLHALPPSGRPFEPLRAAGRYARQLGSARALALYGTAAEAFARIEAVAPALCHNDLVCDNIIEGESGPVLIDWEYAGDGDPFFDLAVVVQHHDVPRAAADAFLAAYLGRPAGPPEREHLARQRRFYRCLLDLWYLRTRTGPDA